MQRVSHLESSFMSGPDGDLRCPAIRRNIKGRTVRQQGQRELLAEGKKHTAWKRLGQIPSQLECL